MLPRSMFMNPDRYRTQIDAYSKLIAGTVFLVHKEFTIVPTRSKNIGYEIADEIVKFETQLANVFYKLLLEHNENKCT